MYEKWFIIALDNDNEKEVFNMVFLTLFFWFTYNLLL